jgi:hypothetical protein
VCFIAANGSSGHHLLILGKSSSGSLQSLYVVSLGTKNR